MAFIEVTEANSEKRELLNPTHVARVISFTSHTRIILSVQPEIESCIDVLEPYSEIRRLLLGPQEPTACRDGSCGYQLYVAVGDGQPSMPHEAFHAAEAEAERHSGACNRWREGQNCPTCLSWERRLRA